MLLPINIAAQWAKARDFELGQEAVKLKRELYLPALANTDLYNPYIERAVLLEVVTKTIASMKGLCYRRDPEVVLTARTKYMENRASNRGETLYTFAKAILHQVINPSRIGILVDVDAQGKPYFARYLAEDILAYEIDQLNGQEVVTAIKLRETYKAKDAGLFSSELKTRFRLLRLVDGRYIQQIVDDQGNVIQVIEPSVRGASMDYIPFVFINGDGTLSPVPCRPALMPIVNLNESHYRTSADKEHALHYTALPQLYLVGFTLPEGGVRKFGPAVALESSDPQAKAGFIQPPDIACIERALEDKQNAMSVLGANLFMEGQTAGTATEATLRNTATNSQLTNIVVATSDGLTQALNYADRMLGGPGTECRYELNTSFYNTALNPAEIVTLTDLYIKGTITQDTYLKRLSALEVLPPGKTAEDEARALEIEKKKKAAESPTPAAPVVPETGTPPANA